MQEVNKDQGKKIESDPIIMSRSYHTTLAQISLGGITMSNVPASIGTGMDFDEVLLGMSFLKNLEITQKSDSLIIRIPD